MRICSLDGERITDREVLHDILAAELRFPDWYGRNLDALYDCLTDIREETEVRISQRTIMERNLGGYSQLLLKVLQDASKENSYIHLKIVEKTNKSDDY